MVSILLFLAGACFYWFYTVEDAFISYRYVDRLVGGDGLVFNPGERVEGYTNFLWVLVLTLPRMMGSTESLPLAAKWVGLFCSLFTLVLSYGIAGRTLSRTSAAFVPLLIAASPGLDRKSVV